MKIKNIKEEELYLIDGGSRTTDMVGDALKIAGGVITSVSLIGTGPAGIAGAGILIASTIESASDFYDTYYRK